MEFMTFGHGVWQVYYVMGTSDSMVQKRRKRINNRTQSLEVATQSNGHSLKASKFQKLLLSRLQSIGPWQATIGKGTRIETNIFLAQFEVYVTLCSFFTSASIKFMLQYAVGEILFSFFPFLECAEVCHERAAKELRNKNKVWIKMVLGSIADRAWKGLWVYSLWVDHSNCSQLVVKFYIIQYQNNHNYKLLKLDLS